MTPIKERMHPPNILLIQAPESAGTGILHTNIEAYIDFVCIFEYNMKSRAISTSGQYSALLGLCAPAAAFYAASTLGFP
ncbi:hypothetical protein ccbrp13_19770 [Ktedonobacteria bacterium brp13]|nr:hypothetical protein ccbrp13_19770 [Ktedonobacteria bacterium brp13]